MYETKPGPAAKRGFYVELHSGGQKVGQVWLADSEKAEAEALVEAGHLEIPGAPALRNVA